MSDRSDLRTPPGDRIDLRILAGDRLEEHHREFVRTHRADLDGPRGSDRYSAAWSICAVFDHARALHGALADLVEASVRYVPESDRAARWRLDTAALSVAHATPREDGQ